MSSDFVLGLIFLYLLHNHLLLSFAGVGHDIAHGHLPLVHALDPLLFAYLLAFKYYLVIDVAAKGDVAESPILLIEHFS